MSNDASDAHESTDLDNRTQRALEQRLTVLTPDATPITDPDRTVVSVTSQSGETYTVDVRDGRCDCPDSRHRTPDSGCKHVRRARIALGRQPVTTDTLAANAPGPRVATTDGGLIGAGDDAEVLSDDRPDDCDCWDADTELPCWPCYRDGFDVPNPSAGEE
jgi:hypothetical protein